MATAKKTEKDDFAQALNHMAPFGNQVGIPLSGKDEPRPVDKLVKTPRKYPLLKYDGFNGMLSEFVDGTGPYDLVLNTIIISSKDCMDRDDRLIYGTWLNGIVQQRDRKSGYFHLIKVKHQRKYFAPAVGMKLTIVRGGDRVQIWEDIIRIWRLGGRYEVIRVPVNATRVLCLETTAFLQLCLIENTNPGNRPLLSELLALILQFMKAANHIDITYDDAEFNLMIYDNIARPLIGIAKVALGQYAEFRQERTNYIKIAEYLLNLNIIMTKSDQIDENHDLCIFMQMFTDFSKYFQKLIW
jgi:hypothetical protein